MSQEIQINTSLMSSKRSGQVYGTCDYDFEGFTFMSELSNDRFLPSPFQFTT